jgi:medium-chain acyl-[acyl-carrier-protein] hydrolase
MEKSSVWIEPFKVRSYHMDMKARATIMSIVGYLQEAAGNHADSMNFGFKDMKKSGLVWLLTRVKILVHQYPKWGEEIEVTSWVVNAEKFFSRRDFEIRDKSGKLMVSAISGWMLVNAKEKRPHLVEHVRDRFFLMPDKMAIQDEIQKIDTLNKMDSTSTYTVKYSDIDIVGHVNNIQYYSIILDSLAFDFRKENHIKSFEINYLTEALPGDNLEVLTEQLSENKEYKHEIKRIADQKAICRAIINWEKDEDV